MLAAHLLGMINVYSVELAVWESSAQKEVATGEKNVLERQWGTMDWDE